jgi:hypothetical protein
MSAVVLRSMVSQWVLVTVVRMVDLSYMCDTNII